MSVDILSVSSKGQIVLPMEIRRRLNIGTGAKLAAYAVGNMIMLQQIDVPTEEDFKSALDEASQWAKDAGYAEADINGIIKSYRKSRR